MSYSINWKNSSSGNVTKKISAQKNSIMTAKNNLASIDKKYKCRDKQQCPLGEACLAKIVVYRAVIWYQSEKFYIDATER